MVDWPQLIGELVESGLTQKRIAERCGVAQPTISDIARGVMSESGTVRSPSFALGMRLLELRDEMRSLKATKKEAV